MLVADRQAQQRRLAAHRRGPGRVGRTGPVGQVQQLVAGLGRLAAPHLHAALQVARRHDQRGVVGLDQGQVEQRGRRRDVAGGLRGERRLQQPADARRARRAQPRRTLEERERGDVVVAGGRAAGCGGELRGHVLVRARGRRGEVERPALGGSEARAPAVHGRERPVRRALPARRGGVVDRAADQRVAEVRTGAARPVVAVVAAQEVGRLGRLEVADVEALLGQRLGDGVVRGPGDGDQQQGPAGGVGQPGEAPLVGAHEPGAEPDRFDRQRRRPGHRKLEQGQRVARGRLPGGARQRGRRPEQPPGRAQVEPTDRQLRQGPEPALHRGRRVGAWPCREQHGDRLGPHPAHREHQRLEGGQVQAVRVVDGDQQGPLLGGVREQAQRRHRDAEPVARPGAEVQRPLQGGGLGPGEGRDAVEQRPEQQ